MFADLFGSGRGRPSVPADVIATVMVLQALEGLSDPEVITQLRNSISWKVAAGRSLADEGFHPTVLTLWRNKLRMSDRPQRIFDAVREVINATNVLAGKTRRALDSTVLDDALTRQDAIMQVVAQIRRVRRLVPAAKALALIAHDYDNDAGKPACAWNDRADIDRSSPSWSTTPTPSSALDGVELDDVQAEAVGVLALVAGQDVEPGDSDGTWRIGTTSCERSSKNTATNHDPRTLTGLTTEIAHLRTAVEALADRVRNQEENERHVVASRTNVGRIKDRSQTAPAAAAPVAARHGDPRRGDQ